MPLASSAFTVTPNDVPAVAEAGAVTTNWLAGATMVYVQVVLLWLMFDSAVMVAVQAVVTVGGV